VAKKRTRIKQIRYREDTDLHGFYILNRKIRIIRVFAVNPRHLRTNVNNKK
jgi:hypothetical protein